MSTRIEDERREKRMTKEQISRKLGITSKTYRGYIGGTPISSNILLKMCDMFNCSLDYLLERSDNRKSTE